MNTTFLFSTIEVTRQVFYKSLSASSYAIVNLKPIVPGHVLVVPTRSAPRLADLSPFEISDLMISVQHVGTIIQREYNADALTIACQDGKAAGQTIPHVHFHILPRKASGDAFSPPSGHNDDVYPAIEQHEKALLRLHQGLQTMPKATGVDADEHRKPRSMDEMEREAKWLSSFFD